jgi:hypothetical protein
MYRTARGTSRQTVACPISVKFWIVVTGVAACAALCLGQGGGGKGAITPKNSTSAGNEMNASSGLELQIQTIAGTSFFETVTVTLFTQDLAETSRTTSDENGRAKFIDVPTGPYLVEVSAPGYRTAQQQVIISRPHQAVRIVVPMIPASIGSDLKGRSVSISPMAVKETEKALHSLQLNKLDEAERNLGFALAIEPNFADGNYLMGVVLLRKKKPETAASYLEKSLALSPNHAPSLLALGEAEFLQHDYERATASLEKYLQGQSQSPQAPTAQRYLELMRASGHGKTGVETGAGSSANSPPAGGAEKNTVNSDGIDKSELPASFEMMPAMESKWAPPDVDDQKFDVDSTAECQLHKIVRSAGHRVQELVQNVDRFTATEKIDHYNLSPMGLQTSHETRSFDYLVEIHQVSGKHLDVEEFRNGSVSKQDFPEHIATVGLPSLALIFHPYNRDNYAFRCEGRTSRYGHPAWLIHFQLQSGHPSEMLVYRVKGQAFSVGQRGLAWIDANNYQILAMESDIMHSIPEIQLVRDHQLIEYGPVNFRHESMELWLPKSADWYCSLSGHRYHRRHSFSQFLLFATDDKQEISKPKESKQSAAPE